MGLLLRPWRVENGTGPCHPSWESSLQVTQLLAELHFGSRSAPSADFWLRSQPPCSFDHPSVPLSPPSTGSRTQWSPPCWGPVSSWDRPRRPWAPGYKVCAPQQAGVYSPRHPLCPCRHGHWCHCPVGPPRRPGQQHTLEQLMAVMTPRDEEAGGRGWAG